MRTSFPHYVELVQTIDGKWMVLDHGVQVGPIGSQFDFILGCSEFVWDTEEDAAHWVLSNYLPE